MIKILKDDYSTRLLCETLGVHRCNLYHEPRPDEDRQVKEALRELAGAWPTYGYRRLTVMLRRQGLRVNAEARAAVDARAGDLRRGPEAHAPDDGQRSPVSPVPQPGRGPGGGATRSGLGGGHHVHPIEKGVRLFSQ